MTKGTNQAKVTLNSEKNQPITLAIVEFCLSEGIIISQLVTQKILLIPQHLIESISGQSKGFLGQFCPTNTAQSLPRKIEADFLGVTISWATPIHFQFLLCCYTVRIKCCFSSHQFINNSKNQGSYYSMWQASVAKRTYSQTDQLCAHSILGLQ